jgi:thiamine pyrophosphokinase
MNFQLWPLANLINSGIESRTSYDFGASVLINAPLVSRDVLQSVLSRSTFRICADGGANMLYDNVVSRADERTTFIPNAIVGDLDSIRPEVRAHYESLGVVINEIHDQDTTDLEKAMTYVESRIRDPVPPFVVIIGSIGAHEGRIDQFFSVVNVLYKYRDVESMKIIQLGNQSILLVLKEGKHSLDLPDSAIGRHCGLVPLFGRVSEASTSGLEWNLNPSLGPLSFGGLISTNNIIRASNVVIETSDPILFTLTYR